MNMNFKRKLPIPMEIKEQYPVTAELEALKTKRDAEIKDIFEDWGDEEMNNAEMAYYIDVQARVSKKLLEIS